MAAKSPAGVQETYNISPPHLQKLFESLDAEFVKAKYAKSLRMPKTADQKRVFREYLANVKAMYLDPTDSFSESFYLDRNPDVTAAVKADEYHCGFHHWVAYGRDEGRVCRPARTGPPIIENLIEIKQDEQSLFAAIFDDEFYLATYPNIGLTRRDNAFSYFIRIGLRQGHVPVPAASFDESFYLSYYRDVRMAKERGAIPSGYYHYVVAGRAEGRVPVHDVGRLIKLKIGDAAEPVGLSRAHDIAERLVPITIEIDDTRPATLSVFIPTLDPDMMFGGYIAFFHFLCRMIEADYRIRFLIMEDYYSNKDWFMRNVADRPRWAAAFREVEVLNCSQRAEVVPFNSHDVCVAYSTWTMHDAWSVSSRLRKRKVLFFIQEHEDIFHEHGAAQFVVAAAYRLPHFAIFNSDSLEQHFRKHELGVFAERGGGEFLSFPHALASVSPDPVAMARKNRHKRLICYARPEKHASRNLFEICILAIRHALHQGAFSGRWTFHGIGSLGGEYDVDLGGGHHMKIEPRIPQQDYERIIRSFDVGLSLMWAPHPSVLPYELARGGVVTVTNEYGTRTQSQLAKFGHNIVAAIPTIEGVAAALRVAAGRSDDVQARLKGALFDWPTNWDKVFDDRFFRALASQFQIPAGCKR